MTNLNDYVGRIAADAQQKQIMPTDTTVKIGSFERIIPGMVGFNTNKNYATGAVKTREEIGFTSFFDLAAGLNEADLTEVTNALNAENSTVVLTYNGLKGQEHVEIGEVTLDGKAVRDAYSSQVRLVSEKAPVIKVGAATVDVVA